MNATIIKETRSLEETVYTLRFLSTKSLMDACRPRNYKGLSETQISYFVEVQKALREFSTSTHVVKFLGKKMEIDPENSDEITKMIEQYYNLVIKSIEQCQDALCEQEQQFLSGVLNQIKHEFDDYFLTT